ncbi:MAG: helicase-related protein [Planctomycetaceae bacterium]
MTATPIPRSLCLTQFGDLDLTVISELPPGRQKIVTSRITGSGARVRAWEFVRRQLQSGRQAYIVCPLVSSEEKKGGAVEVFRYLQRTELKDYRVGLVHGQMDRGERAQTMSDFRDGEIDALVSTTVIEVGVDVPNATVMVVLQAERFGLSQLASASRPHRPWTLPKLLLSLLRGRLQEVESRVWLIIQSTRRTASRSRKRTLNSGGPGDVLGTFASTAQLGGVADLIRDSELLKESAWRSTSSPTASSTPRVRPPRSKCSTALGSCSTCRNRASDIRGAVCTIERDAGMLRGKG